MENTKRVFEAPRIEAVFLGVEDIMTESCNMIIPDSDNINDNLTNIIQW